MRKTAILTFLAFCLSCATAFAQTATVRGFVYNKSNGEPLIFTPVFLKGTNYGVSTDVNGYFSITKIKPGTYTLECTSLGYDTSKTKITLKANEIITKKLYLSKGVVLRNVVISAKQQIEKTQVRMSVTKVTPKMIQSLPSIGGQADLAQYLQVLPGVIFTGDQGGQLYIRGGEPIQNKVLLDGMVIYNPFHSIGLFSVFDTDVLRNANIYTGGFGAQYGGRISSIMDITTKDGNKRHFQGKLSASTFGAKLLLQGPIKKQSLKGGGSISYILSEKNSYLDQSSKLFYPYIDSLGLPYKYNDIYGKISFNSANGSSLDLFGFNFRDNVDYKHISNIGWNSYGGGAHFVLIPGQNNTLIDGILAYSDYKISMGQNAVGETQQRSSEIGGFNLGMNFTNYSGKNKSKFGFEIDGLSTDFSLTNILGRTIDQNDNGTKIAAYMSWRIVKGKFVFEPGLRAEYYGSISAFFPEPRFAMKYNLSDHIRLKLASGIYSQNIISSNTDQDVVNLFSGYLTAPSDLQKTFTQQDGKVKDIKNGLQTADHLIIGSEFDLAHNLSLNVEGYYKWFTQLTDINRNKIYDDNAANYLKPDSLKKDFIIESGKAYGVDFVLNYNYKNLKLYAVYSYGKVTRWDGGEEFYPIFDRRHNVNLTGSYTFGKGLNWEFDVRWNFGSGFPFTQTQGFYEDITFADGISTNYTNTNGQLGIAYAGLDQGRLPAYHRLDVSLKRTLAIGKNSIMHINLSVTNVYNRENIFYFDRITYTRVNQLPILPSIGMDLTF